MHILTRTAGVAFGTLLFAGLGAFGSAQAAPQAAIPDSAYDCRIVAAAAEQQYVRDYPDMKRTAYEAFVGDDPGCVVEYSTSKGWIYAEGSVEKQVSGAQIEPQRRAWAEAQAMLAPPAKPVKKVAAKAAAPAPKQAMAKPQAAPASAASAAPVADGPKPVPATRVVDSNPVRPQTADPRFDSAFTAPAPR